MFSDFANSNPNDYSHLGKAFTDDLGPDQAFSRVLRYGTATGVRTTYSGTVGTRIVGGYASGSNYVLYVLYENNTPTHH